MTQIPHSLQRRLLILILGTVFTVWLATAWLVWLDARHELDELLDGHLAQAAAILVVQQGQEMEGDGQGLMCPLHKYAPQSCVSDISRKPTFHAVGQRAAKPDGKRQQGIQNGI